jgi:hypothetical protein
MLGVILAPRYFQNVIRFWKPTIPPPVILESVRVAFERHRLMKSFENFAYGLQPPTEIQMSANTLAVDIHKFEPVETEFTASTGRIFKLRELTVWEQLQADQFNSESVSAANYGRMAAAVVWIDGKLVIPRAIGRAACTEVARKAERSRV